MKFRKHSHAADPPAATAGRHTLPPRSPEQIAAALAKSVRVRRQRAEVLAELKAGTLTLSEALAHPHMQRAQIGQVVRSLPGVGNVKAAAILEAAHVDPGRRLSQVGVRQREALLAQVGQPA